MLDVHNKYADFDIATYHMVKKFVLNAFQQQKRTLFV